MNFKKILIISLGTAMLVGILAPVYSLAEADDSQRTALCAKISDVYTKIAQAVAQKEGKVLSKKTEIINKIQDHWTKQDSNLAEKRRKWDDNRAKQIAKLNIKFPDDTQKQAVISFEQAVSVAISARRAAIDLAITNFRQGVQQLKDSRQTKLDLAKAAFKNSIIAAFNKAKTDCSSGVAMATIRENLKNSIATAKEKYQKEVRDAEKLSTGMDQLIAARKTAFEKAIQDFKAAMEKARADFKVATAGQEDPDNSLKQSCENSGGTVATSTCCKSGKNFPNLCLIGICGCSLENSKEIKVCNCAAGKCFNGTACVATQ